MEINQRELYTIKRRKKKIKLSEIASHLRCSVSLISEWERGNCNMSNDKARKYKEYIEEN
ncbi:XRE family transcriptional regulator [Brevibacillus ginsengisoli]|uniref:XRE family transcriptional regulator n=1 Tax=Brevibacillus ginsengisoli TaxID=363854 RepID=UPI003CEEF2EB